MIIKGGTIVNEGRSFKGDIVVKDDRIVEIIEHPSTLSTLYSPQTIMDATGCYVLPGIIDSHVHFREPGLTAKADIESESRAAAAGGVTSFFDMPNTVPQTTTLEALSEKFQLAAGRSHVNYSFFFGATNDNYKLFSKLPSDRIPGVKLFMGSSTGNMLVDRRESLEHIFADCQLPLMVHCEDTSIINHNMAEAQQSWGDDPPVSLHAMIRSEEACLKSTTLAVELARKHGTRLHIAHLSTAEELELIPPRPVCRDTIATTPCPVGRDSIATNITAEACVGYLCFTQLDHARLGALIKVNPAIKTPVDQFMLRQALTDGRITTIATDHAPHLLEQKQGGCIRAASGMPMIQFSLVNMLELVDKRELTLERLVQLMCHNPAQLFGVRQRGYLRKGYKADITIVRPRAPWTVTRDCIQSKCGWSPMEGHEYRWRVIQTYCNGQLVYDQGTLSASAAGEEIQFSHV